jgi:hypothetical protein
MRDAICLDNARALALDAREMATMLNALEADIDQEYGGCVLDQQLPVHVATFVRSWLQSRGLEDMAEHMPPVRLQCGPGLENVVVNVVQVPTMYNTAH